MKQELESILSFGAQAVSGEKTIFDQAALRHLDRLMEGNSGYKTTPGFENTTIINSFSLLGKRSEGKSGGARENLCRLTERDLTRRAEKNRITK